MKFNLKITLFLFIIVVNMLSPAQAAKRKIHAKVQKTENSITKTYTSVEKLLQSMTLEQKIAQLIVIRSFAENDSGYYADIANTIDKYQYGGVCFFKGLASEMVKASNLYQSKAKLPLLISIDGEWGPGMRLTDLWTFPRQQTLGALQKDSLVYKMGRMVGAQCNRLGIHFNYIPAVDINNNPNNPVINTRSFGEDKYNVANKSIAYFKGMNKEGVLGSAKHFPGHGDTDIDSHLATPTINHSFAYMDTVDLYPFKKMIEMGVNSIMVGHLGTPALDTSGAPASLSPLLIDTLLRHTLGFKGLVFTDGLEMNGVTALAKYPGEVEVRALLAGNDILLLPLNPPAAIAAIKQAVEDTLLSLEKIENSCRRILNCKKELGLLVDIVKEDTSSLTKANKIFVSLTNLLNDLNTIDVKVLNNQIFAQATTLLKNKNNILPLIPSLYPKIACLHIGDTNVGAYEEMLSNYAQIDHYYLHKNFEKIKIDSIKMRLAPYDLLIMSITNTNYAPSKKYGITSQSIELVDSLQQLPGVCVLNLFASPYSLNLFSNIQDVD
ncbi:MAG: glycoside hydrolase family 3 N-terminal domain-containing protein, partial [Bacteroidales bacterium]